MPGCGKTHNTWLHSAIVTEPTRTQNESASAQTHTIELTKGRVCLPILPVVVTNEDNSQCIKILALLDNGSNTSFCSNYVIDQLKLRTRPTNITLSTIDRDVKFSTQTADFKIKDVFGRNEFLVKDIYSREKLNITSNSSIPEGEIQKWPHLRDIAEHICTTSDVHACDVHLLIGQDNAHLLAPIEVRRGDSSAPYAVLTALGWTINGPVGPGRETASVNHIHTNDILDRQVDNFWKLEDPSHSIEPMPPANLKVIKLWKDNVTLTDGKYVLPIPYVNFLSLKTTI